MFVNKNRKVVLKHSFSLSFSSEITVQSLSRFDYGGEYSYLRTELNNSGVLICERASVYIKYEHRFCLLWPCKGQFGLCCKNTPEPNQRDLIFP